MNQVLKVAIKHRMDFFIKKFYSGKLTKKEKREFELVAALQSFYEN